MNLDDEICCCHHVSLRKLLNYARRQRPRHPSQLSDCLGAGTGCGWCIPTLRRIHAAVADGQSVSADDPPIGLPDSSEQYAALRKAYIKSGQKNEF
jgi:bacterioferritin-associated ferredoxin